MKTRILDGYMHLQHTHLFECLHDAQTYTVAQDMLAPSRPGTPVHARSRCQLLCVSLRVLYLSRCAASRFCNGKHQRVSYQLGDGPWESADLLWFGGKDNFV